MTGSSNDTTFVLTSCKRPDLLSQTLDSLSKVDMTGIKEFVVIEDSDSDEVPKIIPETIANVPVRFIQNNERIGQLESIDLAYSTVTTPFIYHCEDDWIFPSSLFMEQSRLVLAECPNVTAVMVRDPSTLSIHKFRGRLEETKGEPKARFWRYRRRLFKDWGFFSFNPGLRRKSDYDNFGPYAPHLDERFISRKMGRKGGRLAYLLKADVYHIGWENSMREQVLREKELASQSLEKR